MGKRKLNGTSFWQCDWTGLPMKQAFCYWPSWSPTGKLFKKGSYCNWEAVVAHAKFQLDKSQIDATEHDRILQHVENVTGTVVEPAPHYEELSHTKGRMSGTDFHAACAYHKHPITGVKISSDGDVFEVLLQPEEGRFVFGNYLHKPFNNHHGPPNMFHSMRKKGGKGMDRDLSVWYFADKSLQHNAHASNLFKMQLYGDVLLVQQSREQCFMSRERYVSFTKAHFDEQFCKKRKRPEVPSMSMSGYAEIKEQMQTALNQYEATAAAGAVPPKQMACTPSAAPTDGRALAKKVKARAGTLPPKLPAALAAHLQAA
jgi:hypothetical protein